MRRVIVILLMLVVFFIVVFSIVEKKKPEKLAFISGSGRIEVTEIEISSKIPGRVQSLRVDEGEQIDSGKVLIELDHNELDAQLTQAKASLNVAKTRVDQARSEWEKIGVNLKRIRERYQTGSAPEKESDDVETEYKLASDEFKLVSHQYEQSKATVELVRAQLENAIILSPIKGVVLEKNTNPGEVVFPGTGLLTLADLSTLWLKIYVDETELAWIKLDQEAKVKVDSYPDRIFQGKVVHISNKAEFTPRDIQKNEQKVKLVFAVKISLDNPEQELKPGMPASVVIILE